MIKTHRTTRKRKYSMRGLMMLSMCGLVVFVVLVLTAITALSGILPSLDDAAYRTLYNHATDNVARLSTQLTSAARATRQSADSLASLLDQYQSEAGESLADMHGNLERIDGALLLAADEIRAFLDSYAASGAFVILNTSYTDAAQRASLYLRDPSPGTGALNKYDFTVLRGHTRLLPGMNLPLEKNWTYEQALDVDTRFMDLPQEAAATYPKADPRDWGYWSEVFRLSQDDYEIVTFTTPIVSREGVALGIFGIELSLRYLKTIIPSDNLPFVNGFYMVGSMGDGGINTGNAFSSSYLGSIFLADHPDDVLLAPVKVDADYQIYTASDDTPMLASYAPLGLYGSNSPFKENDFYFFALSPRAEVLRSSSDISRGIVFSLAIALGVSLLLAILISRIYSSDIETLAREVRSFEPEQSLELSVTGIREMDELGDVVKKMSRDIVQHAARMSSIVDLVGIQMGAFEINTGDQSVFMTDSLLRMLSLEGHTSHFLTTARFLELLPNVTLPERDNEPTELEIQLDAHATSDQDEIWLRVSMLRQDGRIYGTIIDVSEEIRKKKWLEFERDYDPLTHLLNRNSYPARMSALINSNPDAHGVLLFGDLDNLKYINDTFGHDMGDRYIRLAASALEFFEMVGGVVARISGDEFAVYLHGMPSRQTLRSTVDEVMHRVRETEMDLPDGNVQKVRISVGLAFYPEDALSIDTLTRYADFAMYEIKHSVKGGTREFDAASYAENSYILHKPSELDRLIEERRIRFALQPIVCVKTGETHGYEALMRPLTREFHTPLEVLTLAKAQSKLYQMEVMTIERAFIWYQENIDELGECKLFINLIANQVLLPEDTSHMEHTYPVNRDAIVMEITESEYSGDKVMKAKVQMIRDQGFRLALDDYGTGYNNEISLLSTSPDYIKVDMSIIRGIDKDTQRQRLMQQAVEYARENSIQVIAEGVETYEEMDTVIRLGANLLQGYYTGRPSFQLKQRNEEACRNAAELYRRYWTEQHAHSPG